MEVDVCVAPSPQRGSPYRAYRSLLSHERVRELSELRPWRSVIDTAWAWLGVFAGWALCAWAITNFSWAWWALALGIALVGSRYYALFIIGHDGMHRRIFASGQKSELFTDLLLIGPIAMVCRINAKNHLDHHQHLATDADPDLHKHACFNKSSRVEYVLFLTGAASVVSVLRNLFVKPLDGAGDARMISREPGTRAFRYRLRDLGVILGWQALLIGGLMYLVSASRSGTPRPSFSQLVSLGWFAYPVLWLAPVYLFTYLPNLIRSFVEHSHPENDDAADHHRLITFTSNRFERYFLSPMNMNFHIAHHLWPSIPYYNLPIADAELRAQSPIAGLTWRRSYVGYLWTYFVALPLKECRESRHRTRRA